MTHKQVRVRFAPSPTGFLHVGGLRTALFNFLFARKNKGQFILRIEDTDKSREVAGAADEIQSILKEFGLEWDEGPVFQSQRLAIYKKYAQELIERGAAYEDSTSLPPLNLPLSRQAGQGEKRTAVRQKITKEGSTTFQDAVYGKITIENNKLDEGVLLKSDGFPVYNLANVIDDHEMDITHVIRGEEFIPSTPKHILLYRSLGWEPPQFIHLPLILDRERKKLSKRTGDVAVKEYLDKGYLKEAILNFIALLGWNPKTEKEIFSLEELIREFAVEKINKAGAVFDIDKLDFINREWQKKLNLGTADPLYQRALKLLKEKFGNLSTPSSSPPYQGGERVGLPGEGKGDPPTERAGRSKFFDKIWPLVLERIKGPSDLEEKLPEFYFFFETQDYDSELLIWKDTSKERIKNNLFKIKDFLENFPLTPSLSLKGRGGGERVEKTLKDFIAKENLGAGESLWPLRIALSGQRNSPGPFEIIEVFSSLPNGKQIIIKRIEKAIAKL